MATKQAQVMQIDESSGIMEGRAVGFKEELRITYRIGNPNASLALGVLTVVPSGINLESGWEMLEALILSEPTIMDARRQQLELDMKVASAQSVRDQNDTAYYEVQKAKLEQAALAKKIQENQRLLEQTETGLNQAQQRRDEFAQRQPQYLSTDDTLEVLRRAIKVQELRVGELLARREPLVLKAPIDGVVSQILRRPVRRTGEGVVRQMIRRSGEIVATGEPILTISDKEPSEIISYISEEQLAWVRAEMTVQLVKETEPPQIASSKVTYLGPIMEVMPQRLWLVPDMPQWGRPILIEIPLGMKLLPGEIVGIKGL